MYRLYYNENQNRTDRFCQVLRCFTQLDIHSACEQTVHVSRQCM